MPDFQIKELEPSNPEWVKAVLADFDEFLKDHADCERKASGMAMSLVAKYPDRDEILDELIHTGIEELDHFRKVFWIMRERGVPLNRKMNKDAYVDQLLKNIRGGRDQGLLDRLIIAALVENRGFERFKLIAENCKDPELVKFYDLIYKSEARHGEMFLRLALNYFDQNTVEQRYNEMVDIEGKILASLPIGPVLH
ncbi:tRNA-(ms[2]io[6]A)-hydroxylase [Membranihabitans maritimus]|uniref:tRNA-(ms[2]io[6]A)-hydroxylase n=1 Tax=Membranihabitans maritimus TaxID=2904244 RepID=UPI001F26391A|nr:tRNA-(ms[2]io[6]A)-hydroxylase [Membranihabitans maritimus]